MITFHEYLRMRLEIGGFSTEDALACFLPLVREVLEAHAAGKVAPLEGLDALRVDGAKIWFEEAHRKDLRGNPGALRRCETAGGAPLEIVTERRVLTAVGDVDEEVVDLAIGRLDAPITRPVYLPGYVTWEHRLGHHDPLTDIFSLGMILASLARGMDFTEPGDLERFVAGRRNLFSLGPGMHPVVGRAILRMTELDRHRRAQDLGALLRTLENYREGEVEFEFDVAGVEGFAEKNDRDKQRVVLGKLRDRLFEISRRNRLLHFRPTMHSINLTHASVPLSFDIKNIRPDQILVWNDAFHETVRGGGPISLNKYLNFSEAIYLPSVLDRILAEARRDRAEFGFSQLRLVPCFLNWTNLKADPVEYFRSPLILLPVELKKKKGIRDTYFLETPSPEAEINPVVRHQFKQLYGIELPREIDLAATNLDRFFDFLAARVEASDAAVTLEKIDRPRIELVYEKARRRLDQYRRRARLAGRGIRTFQDLDYSYDPANYHPLGIKLFSARVRPTSTHLREIIEERPRPRTFAAEPVEVPAVEKERSFYSLVDGGEENPYVWGFDLCGVTLGNVKYRKMSLVRDYETLLEAPRANPAFEATFSLVLRPANRELPRVRPLDERFDVVPCDPTQAMAIEETGAGTSTIIQGPPGTGKSQTITNLVAAYVAAGKRVLFVCEKRAAIDVVFARLRQRGLHDLCCLIHDSQTDKKAFVMELKRTYEGILASGNGKPKRASRRRGLLLKKLAGELQPLEYFDREMERAPEQAAIPLRELLGRCIELRRWLPELSPLEKERLCDYATWREHAERIASFDLSLKEIQPGGIFADHPLAILSPRVAASERPLRLITTAAEAAKRHHEHLENTLGAGGLPREAWNTPARAGALVEYAKGVLPIAQAGQVSLVDPENPVAARFASAMAEYEAARDALSEAQSATKSWRTKLPPEEVPIALAQARAFEGNSFAWLRPAWWRLRGVLRGAYDFGSHVIRPSWTHVLAALEKEYALLESLERRSKAIAAEFGIRGDVDRLSADMARLRSALQETPDWIAALHRELLRGDDAAGTIARIASAEGALRGFESELSGIAEDFANRPLDRLRTALDEATDALDDLPAFLHCLREIAAMPEPLGDALRSLPLSVRRLEAAVADRTLENVYLGLREIRRFSGRAMRRHVRGLERFYREWLESNAEEIRRRAHRRFLDNVRKASLPTAQLTPEEKEFKRRYNRGRRELEHEFGKSMRYKSIRDLVSGESGDVVKDLKPVWLMSPLSVSDTLPLDTTYFDVVLFDEASQITLEEAVPSIFRATQAVVVGDEMQLPPTDFFSAKRDGEEEEELLVDEDGQLIRYDLESDSFLNHAAKNLPSTMLGWHYRSRSESLISFSNWAFYDGRLLTVPEESIATRPRPPIRAAAPEDAEPAAAALLSRSISFHFMEKGVYEKRRNRVEAEYIARLVRELLRGGSGRSIGVIAFSEAQQDEIEGALLRLAQEDPEFGNLLEAEQEREVDGQFVGLLVKNLENIQGDERDVIIPSICYGYGSSGKMLMNFGPINKSGGEKRLNVAFSRAKHHMAVVSSIRFGAITNDYNEGANCLKCYLQYAEAVSVGDGESARRILRGLSRWQEAESEEAAAIDPVAAQLEEALAAHGFLVDHAVGQSHFRCDLAVRREGEDTYRLGIQLDTAAYYEQPDVLERDMMRPKLLRNFGWKTAFVLAKDWYEDSQGVLDRILHLLEGGEDVDEEATREDR